jgi:prepilin-type N-terminal cleavage/methylation domain-containing protein
MKKTKGLTLIETITVLAITSIIAVSAGMVLYQAAKTTVQEQTFSEQNSQLRLAIERFSRELRETKKEEITPGASTITFNNPEGNPVTYTLTGTSLQRNGISLANGINSLVLSYYDKNGIVTANPGDIRYVTISLSSTEDNHTVTLNTTIFSRNE